jgi:hypothetical protein
LHFTDLLCSRAGWQRCMQAFFSIIMLGAALLPIITRCVLLARFAHGHSAFCFGCILPARLWCARACRAPGIAPAPGRSEPCIAREPVSVGLQQQWSCWLDACAAAFQLLCWGGSSLRCSRNTCVYTHGSTTIACLMGNFHFHLDTCHVPKGMFPAYDSGLSATSVNPASAKAPAREASR